VSEPQRSEAERRNRARDRNGVRTDDHPGDNRERRGTERRKKGLPHTFRTAAKHTGYGRCEISNHESLPFLVMTV
jgi:hypothetical protein